jgi:hypothetical protein
MNILNHKNCTTSIGAPADMPAPDCVPLPVHYLDTPDGIFAVSYWEPTKEELIELNNSKPVVLLVRAQGRQHPVVALTVEETL